MIARGFARVARLSILLAFAFANFMVPAVAATHDDAAHANDPSEWWRFLGRLHATNGRDYAYTLTIFRNGIRPQSARTDRPSRWSDPTMFSATLMLVDERDGTVERGERHARGALGLGTASLDRRSIRVDDWSVGQATTDRGIDVPFDLVASTERSTIRLHGVFQKPSIHLSDGERFAPSVRTTGTIVTAGKKLGVSGKSWYDHTFGTRVVATDVVGWDRAVVQLDDGRELLMQTDRHRHGYSTISRALVIDKRGATQAIAPSHDRARSMNGAGWRSLRTGARYPDLWSIYVPGVTQMLALEPVTRDQEFVPERGEPYYCGVVDVFDVTPGSDGKRLGTGFVELTGYATPVELTTRPNRAQTEHRYRSRASSSPKAR